MLSTGHQARRRSARPCHHHTPRSLPSPLTQVGSPPATRTLQAIKLVAGARHCAILTKNGTVLTWGIGSQGQLGRLPAFDANSTPSISELFVPKPVPTTSIGIRPTSIATIACGACGACTCLWQGLHVRACLCVLACMLVCSAGWLSHMVCRQCEGGYRFGPLGACV